MAIEKVTPLGKITIEDSFFCPMVYSAFHQMKVRGHVIPASLKGKMIFKALHDEEFVYDVFAFSREDGPILDLYMVTSFGTSISKVTREISGFISKEYYKSFAGERLTIRIHVKGVFSILFAERNVVKEFHFDEWGNLTKEVSND